MTTGFQREEVVIRPVSTKRLVDIKELIKFRNLLIRMVRRHVAIEFADLHLGLFWAVARPVLMMLIFVFFRKLSSANTGVSIPYSAYLYSGLILWFFFVEAANRAATSISADAAIMQKVYFPRLLSPMAAVQSQLVELLINFVPLMVIMALVGAGPGWMLVLLPIVLLQTTLLAFGTGCIVAALSTFNKDWTRLMNLVFYVGLFLSPVIYAPDMLPNSIKPFYFVNPMAGSLLAFRSSLFSDFPFPVTIWIYALVFSLLISAAGIFAFQQAERSFLDRI